MENPVIHKAGTGTVYSVQCMVVFQVSKNLTFHAHLTE